MMEMLPPTVQQLLTETYGVIGEPDDLYCTTASYDVDPSVCVNSTFMKRNDIGH